MYAQQGLGLDSYFLILDIVKDVNCTLLLMHIAMLTRYWVRCVRIYVYTYIYTMYTMYCIRCIHLPKYPNEIS